MGVDAVMHAVMREGVALSERELKHLSYRMGEAFGHQWFFASFYGDTPRHFLSVVRPYEGEDYDPRHPDYRDRQIIEVHTFQRYYGEGYERGHLPFLLALASWLEDSLPTEVVLYGGDSDDFPEPWTLEQRQELWRHFVQHGHSPYRSGWNDNPFMGKRTDTPARCLFCDHDMDIGWRGGNEVLSYRCAGCGVEVGRIKDNVTWDVFPLTDKDKWLDRAGAYHDQADRRPVIQLPPGAVWSPMPEKPMATGEG